jgi:hypothetical protein
LFDTPSPLTERGIFPSPSYRRAVAKGKRLLCGVMNYNRSDPDFPPQSLYTEPDELPTFGWTSEPYPDDQYVLPNIAAALAALGLSNNLPDYEVVDNVHGEAYQGNNNQIYEVCIAKTIILDWIRILL